MKKFYLFLGLVLLTQSIIAQDSCASALTIIKDIEYTVVVIDGPNPQPGSCAGNPATAAEWYKYLPSTDVEATITTDLPANIDRDTRFKVYEGGTCGTLTCVGGDDDGGSGFLSVFTFDADAGKTYYIVFDDWWEDDGFDFLLTEAPVVIDPIEFSFQSIPISYSGSNEIGIVDMDGDFLDDIVSVDGSTLNIYKQQNNFSETSISISATYSPSWSIAAGDIDKNGFNDLLFGNGSGVTFMKANATGTAYTQTSGNQYVFSQRSNFVDINNDGHLDAFVCHDVDPNVYYINNGVDNTLVFNQGGLGDSDSGGNYASYWIDYDNDGDVDLFIAKCNGGGADAEDRFNQLHRNNGDGTFTDVSVASSLHDPAQTWSSAIGDYDNDGDLDIYVGVNSLVDGSHKLMLNNNDGTFSNGTAGTGIESFNKTNREHITHDFDNDGYLDIFTSDDTIFRNNGDLTFTQIDVGFGAGAVGDLNNDGFLDVYNKFDGAYINDGNDNNWIKINTLGTLSNINGIGARVEVHSPNLGMQIRDVKSGDGFAYMSSLTTHFGVGTETEITKIVIRWPSGTVDEILSPNVNTTYNITEVGGTVLSADAFVLDEINLYPNPASDFIEITGIQLENVEANLFDIQGREIDNIILNSNRIDVSNLATGVYILKLKSGVKTFKKRIIKK